MLALYRCGRQADALAGLPRGADRARRRARPRAGRAAAASSRARSSPRTRSCCRPPAAPRAAARAAPPRARPAGVAPRGGSSASSSPTSRTPPAARPGGRARRRSIACGGAARTRSSGTAGRSRRSPAHAVVGIFGARRASHEDDALRAVRAALELREAWPRSRELERDHGIPFPCGGGQPGEVFVGAGARARRSRRARDRRRRAARRGRRGREILLGEPTYRLVAPPSAPSRWSRSQCRTRARSVRGCSSSAPASRCALAPAVARSSGASDELARAARALADAPTAAACRLVTVVGAAGDRQVAARRASSSPALGDGHRRRRPLPPVRRRASPTGRWPRSSTSSR